MTRREKQILSRSQALGRPDTLPCMLRFGIESENAFGVAIPELRPVAMDIGQVLPPALALRCSGVNEVRLFASIIAVQAVHDKAAHSEVFTARLPIVASDPRIFVNKAVNSGLLYVGKRNHNLNSIADKELKPARWFATDALRQLESEPVQIHMNRMA